MDECIRIIGQLKREFCVVSGRTLTRGQLVRKAIRLLYNELKGHQSSLQQACGLPSVITRDGIWQYVRKLQS